MKILDEIIDEICQKEGESIVYKEVLFDTSIKYNLFHDDRITSERGKIDLMEGGGLKLIYHGTTSFQDGYKLKQPVCFFCGSETFLNTENEEYYCPVHHK